MKHGLGAAKYLHHSGSVLLRSCLDSLKALCPAWAPNPSPHKLVSADDLLVDTDTK